MRAARTVTLHRLSRDEDRWCRVQCTPVAGAPSGTGYATPQVGGLLGLKRFYVAHQCGGGDYPQFSEAGVRASLDAGYDALEVSVRRCADGEFICCHDWTTEAATGTRMEIWKTPSADLRALTLKDTANASGQHMLTLRDLVGIAGTGVTLLLDLKDMSDQNTASPSQWARTSEDVLVDFIRAAWPAPEDRVMWKSFDSGVTNGSYARVSAALGLQGVVMLYASTAVADEALASMGMLGMTWNAGAAKWAELKARGKPIIAHIVTSAAAAEQAWQNGAAGVMCSVPTTVNPATYGRID